MTVLIIVHVESEGPGTLGSFLDSSGGTVRLARAYSGERLPENIDGLQAIISMGGPMNVYEESDTRSCAMRRSCCRKQLRPIFRY